jgi:uncharacterized protein (DUF1330 family)
MAKGYILFTESIRDRAGYDGYVGKALPTIVKSGGKPIIVADDPEVLEGKWHGTRTVVLEFDSVEAARKWYQSSAYQAVIGERHASTDANVVIVSGFEMPAG